MTLAPSSRQATGARPAQSAPRGPAQSAPRGPGQAGRRAPAPARRRSKRRALKTHALWAIVACFAVSVGARVFSVEPEALRTEAGEPWIIWPSASADPGLQPEPMMDAAAVGDAGSENAARMAAEETAIRAGAIETAATPDEDGGSGVEVSTAPKRGAVGPDADPDVADLLAALRRREAELNAFAERLEQRRVELDAAARLIDERIAELETVKEEFEALVASVDEAAERDVEHLIDVYSRMKPKDAGPLFDAMAPSFAAGFLGRMRADRASAILAAMDTTRAYAVSVELAGRNIQLPAR